MYISDLQTSLATEVHPADGLHLPRQQTWERQDQVCQEGRKTFVTKQYDNKEQTSL
jgi:hypothetical protein